MKMNLADLRQKQGEKINKLFVIVTSDLYVKVLWFHNHTSTQKRVVYISVIK
jgi:hypothetical protein